MGFFPESLKCPVCLTVPTDVILQCQNGHSICYLCCTKVSSCPHCRVGFERAKIRNRALEDYLDKMKYDCAYKSEGCREENTRQTLSDHEKNCCFGGPKLQLCKQLGLHCDFAISTRKKYEAFAHFQSHVKTSRALRNGEVYAALYSLRNIDRSKRQTWEPRFLNLKPIQSSTFLFLLTYNEGDQTISPICLQLCHDDNQDKQPTSNIRVEYVIRAVKYPDFPHLVWNTSPVELSHAEFALKHPTIRVPFDHIISHYTQDFSVKLELSMFNRFVNIASKSVKSAQPNCAVM